MATKKYLMENGTRAFPCDSIPHSKESNLMELFFLGPSKCVDTIVTDTKAKATMNIKTIG
jgi:hypothetical protein